METTNLPDLIKRYVSLPSSPSAKGWYPILCKVCNDHGNKGPRAAFKFEGDTVAYHCFNCGPDMNTVYDPDKHETMPSKMEQVLNDYGVPDLEWKQVVFNNMAKQGINPGQVKQAEKEQRAIEPKHLPTPANFYFLNNADPDDKWAMIAKDYLQYERDIDPNSYPFMLAGPTDKKYLHKWLKRVIIPIYKNGKLIFYMGRDLTESAIKKYESPPISRDNLLYGFDKLFIDKDLPLFVVEGWFDAFAVDGVAIFGNDISEAKRIWLDKSPRPKVYIPDRLGDGHIGANQAIKFGWHISTPDIGGCKDMSDAVKKYGRLYVVRSILDNMATGFDAQARIGIYCS